MNPVGCLSRQVMELECRGETPVPGVACGKETTLNAQNTEQMWWQEA